MSECEGVELHISRPFVGNHFARLWSRFRTLTELTFGWRENNSH